jgi:hypothetical protein
MEKFDREWWQDFSEKSISKQLEYSFIDLVDIMGKVDDLETKLKIGDVISTISWTITAQKLNEGE